MKKEKISITFDIGYLMNLAIVEAEKMKPFSNCPLYAYLFLDENAQVLGITVSTNERSENE
jgi:hypothetical protein